MADFKSRMAAINKKKSVLDDLAAVESNRVDLEEDFNVGKTVDAKNDEVAIDKSIENMSDTSIEKKNVKSIAISETTIDSSSTRTSDKGVNDISKDHNEEKKDILTEKIIDQKKELEDKKTPKTKGNEAKTETVKELISDNTVIDKSSLSLGRTSINYIKINAKLQRVSQTEFFIKIIEDLKQTKSKRISYDYDNFETERRVVVNRSSINIFLPHDDMEWLKDYAAVNCMSVSHIIEDYIQNKIKEEQA